MIGIDLFAGAGGMSLGAAQAGVSTELAVELDRFAAETYASNHPKTQVFCGDIHQLSADKLKQWGRKRHEIVVFGGPPCQGFSWSNLRTRNTSNQANWLFREFLRVVDVLKPAWVVFENVRGIVDTAKGTFLSQITEALEAMGYHLTSALLNAMHYGVPQDRTRFFLVASPPGVSFRFPRKATRVPLAVDNAIRDLPHLASGDSRCWRRYGRARPSLYGGRLRGKLDGCCNHLVTRNAPFVLQRYKHVPPGGNWEDIPNDLMHNYQDRSRCHTGIYHRLDLKEPSVVIGNFRKNMLIHPTEDRGLSVREAARIQSFPDWYTFHGSIGFQQQQVGNAVPPLLAKAVFRAILNHNR